MNQLNLKVRKHLMYQRYQLIQKTLKYQKILINQIDRLYQMYQLIQKTLKFLKNEINLIDRLYH